MGSLQANALAWIAGLVVAFTAIGVAPEDSPVLIAVFGVVGGLLSSVVAMQMLARAG
jgi:hypothetical protein